MGVWARLYELKLRFPDIWNPAKPNIYRHILQNPNYCTNCTVYTLRPRFLASRIAALSLYLGTLTRFRHLILSLSTDLEIHDWSQTNRNARCRCETPVLWLTALLRACIFWRFICKAFLPEPLLRATDPVCSIRCRIS